jgi:diguanylate cyclase (GGDEF)-like protein
MTNSVQRLVKIIRFSQVLTSLSAVNHAVKTAADGSFFISINAVVLLFILCSLLAEPILKLIKANKVQLGFRLYLVLIVMLISVGMWAQGGIDSLNIMSVPILLMFGALYGDLLDSICLCVAMIFVTILISFNSTIGWFLPPSDILATGYHRLIEAIFITGFAGYITWAVGHDMRRAFGKLSQEYNNVKASKAEIVRLSKTDVLTGLVNVKQARENYEAMLATLPKNHCICFYFIDLDGFKVINDLFDHKAGDNLLILVANSLTSVSSDNAEVCRLSGDEFAIFFVAKQSSDSTLFAQKLLDKIAEPYDLFGTSIQVTASIGIAETVSSDFDRIRKKADMAMFQSKGASKNNYLRYSRSLEREYMKTTYVVDGLKETLDLGLLELHYQPQVDLPSQKVIGAEALIRWPKNNPQDYTPEQFMGVIESTELVHEVGEWVIKEACTACKSWHEQGFKITVAVNVSAQQLLKPDFAKTVERTLLSVGLEPRYLEVELTERYLVDSSDGVEKQLCALRKVGVKLSIDDFGTGYSNVSYLTDLDVDVLKLDQSFIRQLQSNEAVKHIVTSIIQIAKVMDMRVVAEGVESDDEMQNVTNLGCEIGQGYFWSKPLTFKALGEYLHQHRESI